MDPTGGILPYVVNKLGDLILSEAALLANTLRDLEWVQRELRMMQAALEHVATMKIQDARLTIWIEDVRKLAFHAEDVVDTFYLHAGNPTRISFLSFRTSRTKSRHDFGTQITQLKETVAELSTRKTTYDIKIPDTSSAAGTVDRRDELHQFRRLTAAPYVEDRDVVGLDDHVKAVTDLLVREGSKRSVVSIVGMGGIGKTTLAKKVYNNLLRSYSSFDCTAWVDVSQKYDILDLLKRIAQDTMKLPSEDVGKMNQGTVMAKLYENLHFKRYLIVLDDVWTSELWDMIDTILPDPKNGSRIIITTRKMEVARSVNPRMPPYELSALGEEESRVLFSKKAFPNEDNPEQCCTGELASLREQILRKCGGLPLAIIVVGGLLSRKGRTPKEWSEVSEKIDWEKTKKGEQCMDILALSYIDLPIRMRWCFLYLASIPEDCEASVYRLQRLWIAEGFIEEKAGESIEDTAERYLEELVQRCLIQVVQKTNDYEKPERYCRIHDLLLDLAVSEAKKIRFVDVWKNPSDESPGVLLRRLSINSNMLEGGRTHLPLERLESNKLRTLLIMNRWNWRRGEISGLTVNNDLGNIKWSSLQRNLKLLRVLELAVYIEHLPNEIGDMANLRYLALSGDKIRKLPKSVGKLQHLQTLDVGMTGAEFFPSTIWRIKTLRYLRGGLYTGFPMPKAVLPDDTFKNLRALRFVRAYPWMEKIFPYLTNLRELEIRDVQNLSMSSLSKAIGKLQWLHLLILHASRTLVDSAMFELDDIFLPIDSHTYLQSLELNSLLVVSSKLQRLPQNLAQVELAHTKINHGITELLGNLKYLHMLKLSYISFTDENMVFRSGWFPRLGVLHMDHLDIKRWEVEEQSLSLLGELHIAGCPRLETLPEGLSRISTLKEFALVDAPLQLKERLRRPYGEDWHKVQHIERVDIYSKEM